MTLHSPKASTPLTPAKLEQLRRDAKRLSKTQSLQHSEALDIIASEHGFKNWQLLHRAVELPKRESPPPPAGADQEVELSDASAPSPLPAPERAFAHLPSSNGLQLRMDASRGEVMAMKSIVERYEHLVGVDRVDRLSTMMDLEACHCNCCPLDLTALLEAGDLDLVHDVAGITRHLDRETGKLVNFFRPRYAA